MLPEEITATTTPEEIAKSIIDNPNLWGMYSIADAIHKIIRYQTNKKYWNDNDMLNAFKHGHFAHSLLESRSWLKTYKNTNSKTKIAGVGAEGGW